jgi:hypothetical protein
MPVSTCHGCAHRGRHNTCDAAVGQAQKHVPAGNWTAIAALRPGTGSWDSYDHEPSGPLVSPIVRRTFVD